MLLPSDTIAQYFRLQGTLSERNFANFDDYILIQMVGLNNQLSWDGWLAKNKELKLPSGRTVVEFIKGVKPSNPTDSSLYYSELIKLVGRVALDELLS